MKNKGFTIVEMLSAFILSSIIIIILFQLIINLKEVYQASGSKTDMLNKKNILIDKVYSDLNEKKLVDFSTCGSNCINLIYSTGETKQLMQDNSNKTITYGDYVMKVTKDYELSDIYTETSGNVYAYNNEAVLNIKIPIISATNEDYSINIVYPYTSNEVNNHTTYVQNGLITYLDGINNTGTGHSNYTTTWVDLSGNGNDAIIEFDDGIGYQWGEKQFTFDGEQSYAKIENMAGKTFPNGVTLETRVKVISTKGATGSGTVEFMNNFHAAGFGISYYSNSKFGSAIHTNGAYQGSQSTATSGLGIFYTLTLTYDNFSLKIYENGVLKNTKNLNDNTPITTSPIPMCIGCNPNSTGVDTYSNIAVENVLIYDRALTEDEVMQNYRADQAKGY